MQTLQSRDGTSGNCEWLLAVSALTQLCIVTDRSIPDLDVQSLAKHFSGVSQIAVLRIHDAVSLHKAWVASDQGCSAMSPATTRAAMTPASLRPGTMPLRHVPRSVSLLIWSDMPEVLDWIGSVYGHVSSHASGGSDQEEASAARLAIKDAYAVLRTEVQRNLGIEM